MASYLSKISALVTVNTGQARQALSGFAGDAKGFAQSLDTTFARMTANTSRSFDKIWTDAQKLQRMMKAGIADGVDPSTMLQFANTKRLETEMNKIAELRKRAMGMQTTAGTNSANAEVDKLAESFTKLHDRVARTGNLSKSALQQLQRDIQAAAQSFKSLEKTDARYGTAQALGAKYSLRGQKQALETHSLIQAERSMAALQTTILRLGGGTTQLKQAFADLAKWQQLAAEKGAKGQEIFQKELEQSLDIVLKLIAAQAKSMGIKDLSNPAAVKAQMLQMSGMQKNTMGMNAGMALGQLTYALDDFMSATGGVDQKIRAMGNNISQLGFIAGGTAGLIAGVAVNFTAQLGVALWKQMDATADSALMAKLLADAENKLTSAREKAIKIIDDMVRSLRVAGMSDEQRRQFESGEKAEDFLKAKREEAIGVARTFDPQVRAQSARIGQIDEILKGDIDPARRVRLQEEREELLQQRREREDALLAGEASSVDEADRQWRAAYARIKDQAIRAGDLSGEYMMRALEGIDAQNLPAEERRRAIMDLYAERNAGNALPAFGPASEVVAAGAVDERATQVMRQAEKMAEVMPSFDDVGRDLEHARQELDSLFDGMVPPEIDAQMADFSEQASNIMQSLADGEITADEASASLEGLNVNLIDFARQNGVVARSVKDWAEAHERAMDAMRKSRLEDLDSFVQAAEALGNNRFSQVANIERVASLREGAKMAGLQGAEAETMVGQIIARDIAPMLMQMNNDRMNALMPGVNRGAMSLTDISTSAGMAEFNRIMRGDDAAKNMDLVELRRQTGLLAQIAEDTGLVGVI